MRDDGSSFLELRCPTIYFASVFKTMIQIDFKVNIKQDRDYLEVYGDENTLLTIQLIYTSARAGYNIALDEVLVNKSKEVH